MYSEQSQEGQSQDVLMDTVGITKVVRKEGTSFIEKHGLPMIQGAVIAVIVLLSAIISASSIATKITNNIADEVGQVLSAVDEANSGISTDVDGNLVTADGDVVTTKSLTQQTSVYDLATFSITTLQELMEVVVTDGSTTYIIRSDYVEKPATNEVIVVSGVGLELYVSQDTALLTLRNGDVVDVTTSLHTERRQLDNGDVVETGATITGTDIDFAAYATTETITYTELSSYTCESEFYSDCQVITDESVCDTAAAFLGWSDTTSKMQAEDQYKVYGCSLYSDTSLQLNPLSSSTKECTSDRPCACQGTCAPAEFLTVTEGYCEDLYDCSSISTTEMCDAAVTELGWADTTSAEQTPSIYKTNGCIMYSETSTQLNLASDSVKDCSDFTCACVGKCSPVTEVTSGFCTDFHDCAPIESEEDCSSAAVQLEWVDTTATSQTSSTSKPNGCFSDSYTQVNVAPDSDVPCSDTQICACIGTCLDISTSTSTSTSTTMSYYGEWFTNWGDSACSVQCGVGTRELEVLCMSREPNEDAGSSDDWKVLDDDECDPALRPEDEESCSVACLYVSPDGSDNNDGLDISTPLGSVQTCVDISQDQFTRITATEITSGFCSDYDSCEMITDIDVCDAAAALLEWDDTSSAEKTESGFAAGCLRAYDAYTWLNVAYTSTIECSSDRPCACQGECTSTTTTPTAFVDDTPDTVRCLLLEGTYTETQIDLLEKNNLIIEAYNDDTVIFDGTDVVENLIWYETVGPDGFPILEAQLDQSVERVDVIVDTKSMQCAHEHGIQREPCVVFDPTEGYGWGSFYARDDLEQYYDNAEYTGRRNLESGGYVEIDSATCESFDDCSVIDTVDECNTAAAALGWTDTTAAEQSPDIYKPNGCYQWSETSLQLNLEPDSRRTCADKTCACKGTCTVPDYTELTTGVCSDYADCSAITDTAECTSAASFLGWTDNTAAEQAPSVYKTHGCIQYTTTSTQMNDEEDSVKTCADFTCACAGKCTIKPTTNEYVFISSDEVGDNPTWGDYNMACRDQGGYLATISSESDQVAVCANCTGQTCYAGGYTYTDPNPTPIHDDDGGTQYLWYDGEEWGAYQPAEYVETGAEGVLRLDENCGWSFDGDEDTFDETVSGAVCKLGFNISEKVISDFWLSSDNRIQVRNTSGFTIDNPPTIRVKNSDRVEAFSMTNNNDHVWISGLHFLGTTCCGAGPTVAWDTKRNFDIRLLHSHFLYAPHVVRLITTANTGRGRGNPAKFIGNTFASGNIGTMLYTGSHSTVQDNIALFNSFDYRMKECEGCATSGSDYQKQPYTMDSYSYRCFWSNNTFLYNGELGGFYNYGLGTHVTHNFVMGQSYLAEWTDTAAVHVMDISQPDTVIDYNWFLGPSNAKSVRLDTAPETLPSEAGENTTMDHNVFFGMEPFTVKGYHHTINHSTGDAINIIESWALIHDMNWNSTATYNAVKTTQSRGSTAPNDGAPGHTYLNMCDDMLVCNSDLYEEIPSWYDSSASVNVYDEMHETFLDYCPICYQVGAQLDVPTGEPVRPQEFNFAPIEGSSLLLENGDGYVGAYDPNGDYWVPGSKRVVTPFPFPSQ